MSFPSLFVSHGAPTLPLQASAARDRLQGLGAELGRPRAILVASAHWATARPAVNAVAVNDTIHVFHGFPRPLYDLRYPAPGAPDVAARVAGLLREAGLGCDTDTARGLDHGAWVPLLLMYPRAEIPVLQLSIQPHRDAAHHFRLGQALAPLRQEGVLVIGSGSLTHDLGSFRGQGPEAATLPGVDGFADWMHEALRSHRITDLLDYRRHGPFAARNHPTDEHLMPLYVALGAGGAEAPVRRLHRSTTYGMLRMDMYAFGSGIPDAIGAEGRVSQGV